MEHAAEIEHAEEELSCLQLHERPMMRNRVDPGIRYTPRNWCHLPTELKTKCIKDMDFNLRLKLRATAQQEREIVDSRNYRFSKLVFDNRERDLDESRLYSSKRYGEVIVEYMVRGKKPSKKATSSSATVPTVPKLIKKKELKIYDRDMYYSAVNFLAYALKVGKIDVFEIEETYSPDRFSWCLSTLAESAPFRIRRFNVIALKKPLVMFFMKHLTKDLEIIHLNAEGSVNFPFDEFLTFPVFVNAKLIKIHNLYCTKAVSKLAEQWIINDTPIGHKIRTSVSNGLKVMNQFSVKFADRIVTKSGSIVRIRTDNESKHILLRYVQTGVKKYISCSIIASDLKESDYNLDVNQLEHSRYKSISEPCWEEDVDEKEDYLFGYDRHDIRVLRRRGIFINF